MFQQKNMATAIQAVMFGSLILALPALANDNADDEPTVVLEKMVINLSSKNPTPYTVSTTSASTGLDLSIKETPQMVSTVTAQRIKDQDAKTQVEVLKNTTGIHVAKSDGGRVNISSRGFGVNRIQVDGMSLDFNNQYVVGEDLVSSVIYDTVEVTHGATGLLSGSGEPSARVNVVRKRANNATPATEITVNGDEHGHYGVVFDHARGLNATGTVRGRVIASHSDGSTFIDRAKKGETRLYGVIDADISDKTSVGVGVNLSKFKQRGAMWGGLPAYFSDGTHTNWALGKSTAADWNRWDNDTQEYFANIKHNFNDNWSAKLKANHRAVDGNSKLLWFCCYSQSIDKVTGLGASPSPVNSDHDYKQTNIQADIKGKFDLFGRTHQVMLGANQNKWSQDVYYDTVVSTAPFTNFFTWDGSYPEPMWGNNKSLKYYIDMEEKGAYFATQLKPADKLSVILGSRYSEYERLGENWGRKISDHAKSTWTPYAGLTYEFAPNSSVYASYTSIFKPQSVRKQNGDYLDAEMGDTYELGFKSSLMNNKLQTQAGVFYTKKDNVASRLNGVYVQGTENQALPESAYTGVDGVTSRGFEIELSGKFTKNLMGTLGYSYAHDKGANGETITTTIPEQMIKAFVTYDAGDYVEGLTLGGGVNWQSDFYTIFTNPATRMQEKYGQDAYALVNLMARYRFNPQLEGQLNIHNVFDKRYEAGNYSYNQLVQGEPRTISGSLTYRF